MIRRGVQALVIVLLAVAVSACGAGDDREKSNTSAAPAVTSAAAATVAASPSTAAAVASPAAAAASAAETAPKLPVTVSDRDGRKVTVSDISRIIPLNGDIAEVVWALGLGDKVVATDTSANYPNEAASKTKIGYQRQLSAEGILSLRPTLIIGNEAAGPPTVIEQLRGAGVTVVIQSYAPTLDGTLVKIRSVAEMLGVPGRGEELAKKTAKEIDDAKALAAKATSRPRVAFLYVRGATVQQIGGKDSSADTLIATAGGVDAGVDAGVVGFKPLTPEALVTAAPDVLLLLTAGLQSVGGVDGLLGLPGVAQTPAGKNRRVLDYDDQYLLGMGPRVGLALMDLVKGLHPELKTP